MAANYFDTALLGFTGRVDPRFNKPELRELQSKSLMVGLQNTKYLMTDEAITEIKETPYRPVYADQFSRIALGTDSSFTALHSGSQGTSQRTAITWVGFTEKWSSLATTGQDNDLKSLAILDNEIMQHQRNLRERLRIWLVGQLHSNRTSGGNLTTVSGAIWNPATDAYEINDPAQFWAKVTSVMAQNKYYDPLDVFADPTMYNQYRFSLAQGVNNGVNTSYQLKEENYTNIFQETILGNQVAEEYNNGMVLVLPKNSFAIIPWTPALFNNPKPNRDFSHAGEYAGGYGMIEDGYGYSMETMDGQTERLMYGIHGWAQQNDASASNGSAIDVIQQYQMGLYIAFQSAVISNPNETPIYEFGFTG